MEIADAEIPDVKILTPKKFGDHRGFFSETYNRDILRKGGIDLDFVQDNHSLSRKSGVVRGLHFQTPPFAQAKLIRVVRGSIFDVALDLRRRSPTFGRHVTRRISAENWEQLLVPAGFAHGFCTLEPDTEVCYKVSGFYSPDHERGLLWNDGELGIDWPVDDNSATVSERDRVLPRLREIVASLPF